MDTFSSSYAPADTSTDPAATSHDADLIHMAPFNLEEFKRLYHSFNAATITRLPEFYRGDIFFKDPIHELTGLQQLEMYFSRFCNPDTKCSFHFENIISSRSDAYLRWRMTYQNPVLNNGKTLVLDGVSMIRFDTHIYHQEDFYDMGAMVYQHLPVLGWIIKKINARLAGI